jgi:hypothetical protein
VNPLWPPLPDRPAEARAYEPVGTESTAKRASTAKIKAVPQSTAKDLQREKDSTAKVESNIQTFAVLDDLEDDGPLDDFAGLDTKEWRIERRYRSRKDGREIMYWNYRRRKISRDKDGNRRIEYKPGGSRTR